jgi:predicted CoA-binding protein
MSSDRKHQTIVVVDASPKPERYANQAMRLVAQHGHHAISINPAFDEIEGEKCYPTVGSVPEPINTITRYLGKARSDLLSAEIIAEKSARTARIIMNPGAENDEPRKRASTASKSWHAGDVGKRDILVRLPAAAN